MTKVLRKGFVDKNGQQVVIVPNVPGATAGNLASFDAEGNLQDSGKKASDFATASHTHSGYAASSHTHVTNDITDLDEVIGEAAGAKFPYTIGMLTNTSERDLGYIIDISKSQLQIQTDMDGLSALSILTVERLIRHAFRGLDQGKEELETNQLFKVSAYFLTDATDQDLPYPGDSHHATDEELGLCHIWTEKPSQSAGEYNVHIELYLGKMSYYTLVTDVEIVSHELYMNNAEYEAEWTESEIDYSTLRRINSILNSKMNNTPTLLGFQDDQPGWAAGNGSGAFTNFWLACTADKTYPVMCEFSTPVGADYILGTAVVGTKTVTSSIIPTIDIYFGAYKINLVADATVSNIKGGTVEPDEVEWSVTLVDYSSILAVSSES